MSWGDACPFTIRPVTIRPDGVPTFVEFLARDLRKQLALLLDGALHLTLIGGVAQCGPLLLWVASVLDEKNEAGIAFSSLAPWLQSSTHRRSVCHVAEYKLEVPR